MAEVEIKFVTKTEGGGSEKAAQGIRDVKDATAPATVETAKHEAAQKSLGEQIHKTVSAKHGLIAAFKHLSQEVPLLGTLIHAAKNPYTLLAVAIGAVVLKVKDFIKEVDEAAKKMEAFSHANLSITNFFELIAKEKGERKAFAQSLEEIANKADDAATKLHRMNEVITTQFALEGKLADAEKAKKLAEISNAEANGLPKEEADRRRAKVEADAADAAEARGLRERQLKFNAVSTAKRAEEANAENLKASLSQAKDEQHDASAKAAQARVFAEAHAKSAAGKLVPLIEKISQTQSRLDDISAGKGGPGPFGYAIQGTSPLFAIPGLRKKVFGANEAETRKELKSLLDEKKMLDDNVGHTAALSVTAASHEALATSRVSSIESRIQSSKDKAQQFGEELTLQSQRATIEDTFRPRIAAAEKGAAQQNLQATLTTDRREAEEKRNQGAAALRDVIQQASRSDAASAEAVIKLLQEQIARNKELQAKFDQLARQQGNATR